MAAPIRADVRPEIPKREWAINPAVNAITVAQTTTRKSMILDIARLCAPSELRAVLSRTGDLISCDFAPMIWEIAPERRIDARRPRRSFGTCARAVCPGLWRNPKGCEAYRMRATENNHNGARLPRSHYDTRVIWIFAAY